MDSERHRTISASPSSQRPYLPRESGALVGRRGADHRHSLRDGHISSGIALHAHEGVHPRAEVGSAFRSRIVLAREAAESGAAERIGASDIARPASPKQISSRRILFMSIDVSDFDIAA